MKHALIACLAGLLAACAAPAETPVPPTGKRVALSYDDAPRGDGRLFTGVDRTQALIEAWQDAATGPVAIFATTRGVEEASGQARLEAYAEAGHRIANHTHTHPWASRTDISNYAAEIDRAERLLDGLPNRRAWFRFPFLDEGGYGEDLAAARQRRDALREVLIERGLRNGYVTIDTYDWHLDSLLQRALEAGRSVDRAALMRVYADMVVEAAAHYDRMALDVLGERPAHVLLLHENDVAAIGTEAMVEALRSDGWTIIDPDEAYRDPIFAEDPDTLFAGKGRLASLAREAGRSGAEYFDHWSSSESGIEARVEAAGVFSD
ncbi:MAG: polysaccharide deacetylase family protein [Litorimonas sp.]